MYVSLLLFSIVTRWFMRASILPRSRSSHLDTKAVTLVPVIAFFSFRRVMVIA